jgi:crotonobetaine/carnitine-CoA ligase
VTNLRRFLDTACHEAQDRPFLIEAQRVWSYRDLARITDAVAAQLQAHGVGVGDRVASSLPTSHQHLFTWLGAAKLGATHCPLHSDLQPPERARALAHLDPHCVIDAQLAEQWMASDLPFEPRAEADAETISDILTTSGSTGHPKSAMLPARMAILTGEAFAAWLELSAHDRLFTCLPLSHINARFYTVMGAIAARASIALAPRFSASRFWSQVGESQATVCNAIGAMLKILLEREVSASERQHRLRLIYAAPALGSPAHAQFEARFKTQLVIGYGLTESTFGLIQPLDRSCDVASLGTPRRHPDRRWSAEHRIAADGELLLRNDAMFAGYFRDPEATAAAFEDGWLRTGDLVRRDASDTYYFVARKKLVIRRRGENLTPGEVEAVLEQHPAVLEAAVIGVPSPLGEEDVCAVVVLRAAQQVSFDELAAHCRQHLAAFKVPTIWRSLDRLARTATNRIAYQSVREACGL